MSGQTPPQQLEAEENILGALLVSKQALEAVVDEVQPSDFYRESHGLILATALELHAGGHPVDVVTVTDALEKSGRLGEAGGRVRLAELAALVPSTSNAAHHARIVREHALRRGLIAAGQAIAGFGWEGPGETLELVDRAQTLVHDLDTSSGEPVPIGPALDEALLHADRAAESEDGLLGTPSGLVDLDRLTLGFEPGNLIVVAGRPSMGKSALAFQISGHVAVRRGVPVVLFTLEMSRLEVAQRMLSAAARVDLLKVRSGRLQQHERASLMDARERLKDAPLYVHDEARLTSLELRSKVRKLQRRRDVGLVVVDYLGLMVDGDPSNRTQEVGRACRTLKIAASELHVPLLLLSQLNRLSETERRRPRLSDLRDSGEIEQHAHVVVFVHRETKEAREGVLIVGKNRNGPTGDVPVTWRPEQACFSSAIREAAAA